jgi:histidyl-tRNA synthetase
MTEAERLQALRCIDKYDRLGPEGVKALLTSGRRDESGAWTEGLGWTEAQADLLLMFLATKGATNEETISKMLRWYYVMSMPMSELEKIEQALKEHP